ncbi:MAG TPA: hypothetical protein VNF04_04815 [Stellaceae bacterium]|nr:hypothetical protein [Stellaceae bacterium]
MFRPEIATPRSPAARVVAEIHNTRDRQDRALDRLHGHSPSLDALREMHDAAGRHRELFSDLEMVVPEPRPTETAADYQVRLLAPLQRFSPNFRQADLRRLSIVGGLRGIDAAIVADAQAIASNRTVGSFRHPGQLRRIVRDGEVSYHGNPLAWMSQFLSPIVLQVERFRGR